VNIKQTCIQIELVWPQGVYAFGYWFFKCKFDAFAFL